MKTEKKIERIFDKLYNCIILAGGDISIEKLKEMSLQEILTITMPNKITWKISHKP